MTLPDLGKLSDEELEAAVVCLGEKVHQYTLAAEVIRAELATRRTRPDADKHVDWTDAADTALADALAAAPQRAVDLAAAAADAARLEEEDRTRSRAEAAAQQVEMGKPVDEIALTAEERRAVDAILARR